MWLDEYESAPPWVIHVPKGTKWRFGNWYEGHNKLTDEKVRNLMGKVQDKIDMIAKAQRG